MGIDIKIIASGSSGNAYTIDDGETYLLIDAGIPYKKIQTGTNFSTSRLAGCLISHEHLDHCKAVKDLIRVGLDTYTSQGTIDAMNIQSHRIHAISNLKQFSIGTFIVLPFDTEHDANEPLGFLLYSTRTKEKILYVTDSYYIQYRFQNLTHIMIECNYSSFIVSENNKAGSLPVARIKRLYSSHMSIERVLELLKANLSPILKQIYLLHLSDANSNANEFKEEIQKLTGVEVYVA